MLGILVRYGYLPFMLIVFGGGAVAAAGRGAPPWVLIGLVGAAILVSFAAERAAPYNREFNQPRGDVARDAAHFVVNKLFEQAGLLVLPALAALTPWPELWPSRLPFAAQVLFAVVVLDVGITLAHFASHRSALLWRFHAVHHSVERMYGFNGLMKHPLHQAFETAVGAAPLVLMGLPSSVAAAATAGVAIELLLQHSNVDMRIGPLRHVLAVNVVHRFHHRKEPGDGDVNFGLFLVVWDRLLGTYFYEERSAPLSCAELGIGDRPDYPAGYLAQIVEPFRPRASDAAAATT